MPIKVIAIDNEGKKRCSFDTVEDAKQFYTAGRRGDEDFLEEGRHIYMYVGSIVEKEIVVPKTVTTEIVLEDIIS